jgi:hypothetical protein
MAAEPPHRAYLPVLSRCVRVVWGRTTVNKSVLARWRSLDAYIVLRVLADYAKEDKTFDPRKSLTRIPDL